jgi:hypothetical protein
MAQYGGRRTSHIRQMCVVLKPLKRTDAETSGETLKSDTEDQD